MKKKILKILLKKKKLKQEIKICKSNIKLAIS